MFLRASGFKAKFRNAAPALSPCCFKATRGSARDLLPILKNTSTHPRGVTRVPVEGIGDCFKALGSAGSRAHYSGISLIVFFPSRNDSITVANAAVHALDLSVQLHFLHLSAIEAGLGRPDATVISELPHKSATRCPWSLELSRYLSEARAQRRPSH